MQPFHHLAVETDGTTLGMGRVSEGGNDADGPGNVASGGSEGRIGGNDLVGMDQCLAVKAPGATLIAFRRQPIRLVDCIENPVKRRQPPRAGSGNDLGKGGEQRRAIRTGAAAEIEREIVGARDESGQPRDGSGCCDGGQVQQAACTFDHRPQWRSTIAHIVPHRLNCRCIVDLGQQDRVDWQAGQAGEIVGVPRRADGIDTDDEFAIAKAAFQGCGDGAGPGVVLLIGGDGVFQIEDHDVARHRARFRDRTGIGRGQEKRAAAGAGRNHRACVTSRCRDRNPDEYPSSLYLVRDDKHRGPGGMNCELRSVARLSRTALLAAIGLVTGCSPGVLDPAGPVAMGERTVLFNALAIMLCIVVPTILLALSVGWWFRAGNGKAEYRPEWSYSGRLELLVWSIPALVVIFLAGLTWISTHELAPEKPLESRVRPVQVQVVSLDWKWVFIYPELGVATVNRLVIPAGTPISFRITSGTVMNSFFIPQLGSQIYAMSGMDAKLHLQADKPGRFHGLSAHYSGEGFADMNFAVDAVPPAQFAGWTAKTRGEGAALDVPRFMTLARHLGSEKPMSFGAVAPGLYDRIVADAGASVREEATDGRENSGVR